MGKNFTHNYSDDEQIATQLLILFEKLPDSFFQNEGIEPTSSLIKKIKQEVRSLNRDDIAMA